MSLGSDRYRILLTMVHPKPVKMAQQARAALSELPLFDPEIRRLIAYEKASLMGVPVYQVKDRMAKIAWSDYEQVGKEINPNWWIFSLRPGWNGEKVKI